MATLDQLHAALIKADAAGNVEDAKAFASEIRRVRSETTIKAPVVNVGRQPDAIPERDMMQKYGYPVLETVLPVAGGLVGAVPSTVAGPAGTLIGGAAGSGLGYAAAKQIENIYEEQTGKAKAQPLSTIASQAGMDVLTGAAFDVGGRLVLPPLAKAAGWIWDAVSGKLIQVKAGKIVRELAGGAVDAVRNAAASAPANLTAGQAVANVRAPAIQTLQSRMNARNINESTRLAEQGNAANLNQIQALAGGSTQVASKNAQAEAKNALNARLIPTLTTELNTANIAGLASRGLKPLKSDAIIVSLSRKANDPAYAGNDLVEGALKNVADDIAKWTKNGGVIDAWALDSIRKNSVNAAIQRLRPGMDQTAQKNAAAEVISQIKPILVDAVENAGGTGYGKYLADYAVGRQAIAQTKLGAKAMQLYNDSPDKFIALVEGQSPEAVEKIFGKGSYNIAKEMSYDAFLKLKGISSTVQRNQSMAEQAGKGAEKYGETLRNSLGLFRIPNILSPKVAVTNEALSVLEGKLNTKVMKTLEEGMRSGKPLAKLIDTLPAEDRTLVLRLLKSRTGTRAATFGTNALVSDPSFDTEAYINRNALAQ